MGRLVAFDNGDRSKAPFAVNPEYVVAIEDVSQNSMYIGNTLIYLRDAPKMVALMYYYQVTSALFPSPVVDGNE